MRMHPAQWLHSGRAPGGDLDHPAGERGRPADGHSGHQPSPGQRGGAGCSRRPWSGPVTRPSTATRRAGSACLPDPAFFTVDAHDWSTDAFPELPTARSIPTRSWRPTASSRSSRRRITRRGGSIFYSPCPVPRLDHAGNPPPYPGPPRSALTTGIPFSTAYPSSVRPELHGSLGKVVTPNVLCVVESPRRPQPHHAVAAFADFLVLEHPAGGQDQDRQLGHLLHGRRPDDDHPGGRLINGNV